jgi:hypothetical protein
MCNFANRNQFQDMSRGMLFNAPSKRIAPADFRLWPILLQNSDFGSVERRGWL